MRTIQFFGLHSADWTYNHANSKKDYIINYVFLLDIIILIKSMKFNLTSILLIHFYLLVSRIYDKKIYFMHSLLALD